MKLTGAIEIEVPDDDHRHCTPCRFYDDTYSWCSLFCVIIGVNPETTVKEYPPMRCNKCLVTFTRKTEKEEIVDV